MKINIVAVGKLKENYLQNAIGEYSKRLSRFCKLKITEIENAPSTKSIKEQMDDESERLLSSASGYIVALDGKGAELSSEELSGFISKRALSGDSSICFLIGGSHGHAQSLLDKADFVLSFGKLTFPHQLIRVLLVEQIYRAMTIQNGLPYHK